MIMSGAMLSLNIFSQRGKTRFCGSHKECFRTKPAAFFEFTKGE